MAISIVDGRREAVIRASANESLRRTWTVFWDVDTVFASTEISMEILKQQRSEVPDGFRVAVRRWFVLLFELEDDDLEPKVLVWRAVAVWVAVLAAFQSRPLWSFVLPQSGFGSSLIVSGVLLSGYIYFQAFRVGRWPTAPRRSSTGPAVYRTPKPIASTSVESIAGGAAKTEQNERLAVADNPEDAESSFVALPLVGGSLLTPRRLDSTTELSDGVDASNRASQPRLGASAALVDL